MEAAGRAPSPRPWGLVLLCSSLLLNVLLLARVTIFPPQSQSRLGDGLSWSRQAAVEAEAVAATDCSGHGRAYLDSVPSEDGRPACECNGCFDGPDCSRRTPNCTADAESADQMFLEPYWMRHAAASAVVISGWHRLSYYAPDGGYQSAELERLIRRLHRAVGNAVADDKHVVFGTGSMKLLNAMVHALSSSPDASATTPPAPAGVVATAPYYAAYRTQTKMFDARAYRWEGTTDAWSPPSSRRPSVVEFVTSPNNPDSLLRGPALNTSRVIADHAYYWPHFTPVPAPVDEDVMLFSASKLSGHAGSRFGWALIRDSEVARRARDYIEQSSLGESRDTQLRMLRVLEFVLANLRSEDDMFAVARDAMRARWRRLDAVLARSRRFSVKKIPPRHCTYFNRTAEPTPAFAWVRCEWERDRDCYETLLKANIISWSGVDADASARYTRVSLVKSDDDFDALIERLADLVDAEEHDHSPTASSASA